MDVPPILDQHFYEAKIPLPSGYAESFSLLSWIGSVFQQQNGDVFTISRNRTSQRTKSMPVTMIHIGARPNQDPCRIRTSLKGSDMQCGRAHFVRHTGISTILDQGTKNPEID